MHILHVINTSISFLAMLTIGLTISYNDRFAIQKMTRICYISTKAILIMLIVSKTVTFYVTGYTWTAWLILIVTLLVINLLIHDHKTGKTYRAFADEHPRRPAIDLTSTRHLYLLGIAATLCFVFPS